MRLLLDIGNSRIKAARVRGGELQALPALPHEGTPEAVLAQWPAAEVSELWIAHVMQPAREAALIEAATTRFGFAPRFARSSPSLGELRSSYREPGRLGIDRWLAMLAGWQPGRAVVIADAGTALTVDVVDANGLHFGGIIAPGLASARRAILRETRFAAGETDAGANGGLGRDTESCLRQGAMLACLGAIDRAAAAADAQAIRLITGGDAAALAPWLGPSWSLRPLLVLEGLARYAEHPPADGIA
jgi:type III pantothenate kinase